MTAPADPAKPASLPRLFARSRRGNFAVALALIAPVLLGVVGGGIDLAVYATHQKNLQQAADSAALAAVREAALGGWSKSGAIAVADAHVQANVAHIGQGSGLVTTSTTVLQEERRISVAVEQDHFGYFVVGYFRASPQIRVTATAQASSSSTNVCVIGLNASKEGTVSLDSNAILFAPDCAVYSNSSSGSGMKSLSNAVLTSALACSSGGYDGGARNFSTKPVTDCPVMADPLGSRPAPVVPSGCKGSGLVLKDHKGTIGPGTYCGGLKIDGNSDVTLTEGVYVMKDGPFVVDSNSVVRGTGVGIYFTGKGSNLHFKSNVDVSLEAPVDGAMAGLIFYQDRDAAVADFTIESNYTRNLLGTIYLPKGNLVVKADNDVADQSAYTAIVVHTLQLLSGPRLVLNTDYDSTEVPVPTGLGPAKGDLRLVQ